MVAPLVVACVDQHAEELLDAEWCETHHCFWKPWQDGPRCRVAVLEEFVGRVASDDWSGNFTLPLPQDGMDVNDVARWTRELIKKLRSEALLLMTPKPTVEVRSG